ncbi:MAG: hypothetical protein PVH00_12330 [Gemmatimonadota bacterium]|jgi:hypothetical protein
MTLFEYLAIAFGLLYSVAALRVLGGLPASMAPERRYSLHLLLNLVLLMLIALSFWTFWSLKDVDWTFPGFLLALLIPGLLYYCAAVLVPENPEGVVSWRDHYWVMRRRWYGGLAVWGVGTAASASVNLGMGLHHPARIVHVTSLTIGIIGAATSKPRVHVVLVTLLCLLALGGATGAHMQPGWLAR